MEWFISAEGLKNFAKHSYLVFAFIIPESVILDHSTFFFSWLVSSERHSIYKTRIFSRLKFAVLNYNLLFDVYFKLF